MRIIRINTFETNSSSTHSITMCSKSDYEKWKKGELLYDRWHDKLVSPEDKNSEVEYTDKDYFTFEEFFDYYSEYYDVYTESCKTPSGEEVVAFGYYGYDG